MSRYTVLKLWNMPAKRHCIRQSKPGKRIYISEISGKNVEHCQVRKKKTRSIGQPKQVDFAGQILGKQKLQLNYGLKEKHLDHLVIESRKSDKETGENLAELVERRLDNVVIKTDFARSMPEARQITTQGHIQVFGNYGQKFCYSKFSEK